MSPDPPHGQVQKADFWTGTQSDSRTQSEHGYEAKSQYSVDLEWHVRLINMGDREEAGRIYGSRCLVTAQQHFFDAYEMGHHYRARGYKSFAPPEMDKVYCHLSENKGWGGKKFLISQEPFLSAD